MGTLRASTKSNRDKYYEQMWRHCVREKNKTYYTRKGTKNERNNNQQK